MERNVGPLIVVAGVLIVMLGVLVWGGGLSWFGRLPGDIRIERGTCASTSRWYQCCCSRPWRRSCFPCCGTCFADETPGHRDTLFNACRPCCG